MRRVVSLWLPMWPLERLARAEPTAVPRNSPFALVESGVHGVAITAVTAAGLNEGVRPGMSLADARAALPGLVSRPAEPGKDRAALLRLARWTGRYGPNRNVDGADGLWIDITGVAHLFGGEDTLLDDLTQRVASFGVTVQAGLADTPGAAHALARFGVSASAAWAAAPAGRTRQALAALPVEALRLDAARVLLLKRLGLRRIGQLYDIPRESLARRFRSKDAAAAVLTRLDSALGLAAEPRRPLTEPPVLWAARTFAEPLISSEAIETCAADLCAEISAVLQAKALGAKAVRLSLYRSDGSVAEAAAAMSTPCREAAHMLALLMQKLVTLDAGFGVDLMRLDVMRAARLQPVQDGFSRDGALGTSAPGDPGPLIDRLSNRFGAAAITLLEARASHIPERAEARVPAFDACSRARFESEPRPTPIPSPLRGEDAAPCVSARAKGNDLAVSAVKRANASSARLGGGEGLGAALTPPPNPSSGLARPPQSIALSVMAGLNRGWIALPPLGGGECGEGQRRPPFLLRRPEPISVVAGVPDGPPARFTWRRVERRVAKAEGPERVAPEWWRALHLSDDQKRPRPRDYYAIEDERGDAYWVFRHGLYGGTEGEDGDGDTPPGWFLHGLFA